MRKDAEQRKVWERDFWWWCLPLQILRWALALEWPQGLGNLCPTVYLLQWAVKLTSLATLQSLQNPSYGSIVFGGILPPKSSQFCWVMWDGLWQVEAGEQVQLEFLLTWANSLKGPMGHLPTCLLSLTAQQQSLATLGGLLPLHSLQTKLSCGWVPFTAAWGGRWTQPEEVAFGISSQHRP